LENNFFERGKHMSNKRTSQMSLVLTASLLFASSALAQGVGNGGSLPTVFMQNTANNGWNVVDPQGQPIPVQLDPNGPVWSKVFTDPNGGNFFQPAFGPPLPVYEALQVAPTLPWTDWHEDVIHPDWVWTNPSILVNGVTPGGLTITGAGTNSLSFFFNPVAPGSIVEIFKDLVYTGVPGTTFIGTLNIHEYPTPEPASAALLGCAGVLLLSRRRRKASIAANIQ
jgi:hypothetical protein